MSLVGMMLLAVGAVSTGMVLLFHRKYYLLQYLFFIRYQLCFGTALVLLPLVGQIAPESFKNLLVVDGQGAVQLGFFAALTGWSVVATCWLTWISAPYQNGLPVLRPRYVHRARASDRLIDLIEFVAIRCSLVQATRGPRNDAEQLCRRAFIGAALTISLGVSVAYESSDTQRLSLFSAYLVGALIGAVVPLGIGLLVARTNGRKRALIQFASSPFRAWPMRSLYRDVLGPYDIERGWAEERLFQVEAHSRAALIAATTLLIYLAFGFVSNPYLDVHRPPALVFILILLLVMTWGFSFVSFHLDRHRAPGVLLLVVIVLMAQAAFPDDHYYRVHRWRGPTPMDASVAIELRRSRLVDDRPLVLVGCSGGGIAASIWTAIVLDGLDDKVAGFRDAVAAISSVSGGGIGAMYYVAGYAAPDAPASQIQEREPLITHAGESTLSAAAWGLAYPDLWRLLQLPRLFVPSSWDRGRAQGLIWERRLGSAQDPIVTMGDWAQGVAEGWRPIAIMNATLQETGRRLLLSPVRLRNPGSPRPNESLRMREDLASFLPGGDLSVATAARLSAAFPFVAPHAKPLSCGSAHSDEGVRAEHAADGGYFDNSGLVTLIELADDYLADLGAGRVSDDRLSRIAIIEIRAGERADEIAGRGIDRTTGGLANAIGGPISTLYNARISTQIMRTDLETSLFGRAHDDEIGVVLGDGRGVQIRRFTFVLTRAIPLSWHLSREERAIIASHWPGADSGEIDSFVSKKRLREIEAARQRNARTLDALRSFVSPDSSEPEGAAP